MNYIIFDEMCWIYDHNNQNFSAFDLRQRLGRKKM